MSITNYSTPKLNANEVFNEGLVKREDLFITGKLWNSDHDVEIVPKACAHSLSDLGLDYFDLYLIHFPVCWKHTGLDTPSWGKSELGDTPLIDTWRAMESLVEQGVCRSIGVSNYPLMLMHDLVTQAKIQPACNQIEVHAYYQRESLMNYCLARNVSLLIMFIVTGDFACVCYSYIFFPPTIRFV